MLSINEVRYHFSEEALVNLTLAVVIMNSWNRLAISFRSVPGNYESSKTPIYTDSER